jgi:hypothetical protein
VLLDQNFAAGRAFGASGTPSAVLVDAEGKVASEVAVGAAGVMGLAGADRTTTSDKYYGPPDVHKTPIIPFGRIMAPPGVGPPDWRGWVVELSP